jgi:hypothetical protein
MRPINKKTLLLLLLLISICPVKSYILFDSQDNRPTLGEPPKPLFQSDEPLYLTLSMDIKTVFLNREGEESHPAEISYTDPEGNKTTIPIKINVRGHFRKESNNCDFPPLRLNFSDSTVVNTIFDGQDKIKLVTHCQSRLDLYEQNVLKEYLAYKLYNLFTEESYLVRLVHMTYADVKGRLDTL